VYINKFDNSILFRHWYEINISEELRSNVLLLLAMIFVRDGSYYVSILTMLLFVIVTISFHVFLKFALHDCLCLIIALFRAK